MAPDHRELLVGQRAPSCAGSRPAPRPCRCRAAAPRAARATPLVREAQLARHHLGVAPDRLGVARAAAEAQVHGLGEVEHRREQPLRRDVPRVRAARRRRRAAPRCAAPCDRPPLRFAALSAASVARSSVAAVSPCAGCCATPRLIVAGTVSPANSSPRARRSRSASRYAPCSWCPAAPARTRSPPTRAIASTSRLQRAQRLGHPAQRDVADLRAAAVVDLPEAVDVADDHRHRRARAPCARQLEVEQLAKAAPVRQRCQRVRPRRVIQARDQSLRALAHAADERRRDRHRSDPDEPPRHGAARRLAQREQRPIQHPDERDLRDHRPHREEVRRVEEHPEVEEDQRARALRREVGDARDRARCPTPARPRALPATAAPRAAAAAPRRHMRPRRSTANRARSPHANVAARPSAARAWLRPRTGPRARAPSAACRASSRRAHAPPPPPARRPRGDSPRRAGPTYLSLGPSALLH